MSHPFTFSLYHLVVVGIVGEYNNNNLVIRDATLTHSLVVLFVNFQLVFYCCRDAATPRRCLGTFIISIALYVAGDESSLRKDNTFDLGKFFSMRTRIFYLKN